MPSDGRNGSICIVPELSGIGGPSSFQGRLIAGLNARGFQVHHNPAAKDCSAILVIGGPARIIFPILKARRNGIRVVQRLNGMNWMHRKRPTPARYFMRAELNNLVLSFYRKWLANRIVYQSQFAKDWWDRVYGRLSVRQQVTYNGVDLSLFTPAGAHQRPDDRYRVLLVEGHLGGGYEGGIVYALQMVELLQLEVDRPVELMVVGKVDAKVKNRLSEADGVTVKWMGVVPRERIPEIDRSAHILFSSDVNAACPNSVVEALACGLPVVGFASGALPEMVDDRAGCVVPYGSDLWNLEEPVVSPLVQAAARVLREQGEYRANARRTAELKFGLDLMVEDYLNMLLG